MRIPPTIQTPKIEDMAQQIIDGIHPFSHARVMIGGMNPLFISLGIPLIDGPLCALCRPVHQTME